MFRSLGQPSLTAEVVMVVRHGIKGDTIPLVCGYIVGKHIPLSYQSMGRVHRWPALRCLLPVWMRNLVLRAALEKLKKSILLRLILES